MCGILFLAVALMPTRWRMFVSVTYVGEIRTSCEARSTHPCARSVSRSGSRVSCAQVGHSCFLPGSLPPLPKEKALLFQVRGTHQRGVDEIRGFRAQCKTHAKVFGIEGPGGHVVPVAATPGAQGHVGTWSGAGVQRRQLCCSRGAAALWIDTSLSICTDPCQPSLFALPQAVATAPPLAGAWPGPS